MWVLKGDLETQYPQHKELALHNAVPKRPEVGVQLQGLAARVKVPMPTNGNAYGSQGNGPEEPLQSHAVQIQIPMSFCHRLT